MSRWNEKFNNHGFWTSWGALKEKLNSDQIFLVNDSNVMELARLKKVVTFIDNVLEQVDPELINITLLDNFNQSASQCLSELNVFLNNKNPDHLTNANAQIDSLLNLLNRVSLPLANHKLSIKKAASAYAETLDSHLIKVRNFIDKDIADKKSELLQLEAEIATVKNVIENLNLQLKTVEQTLIKQTAEFNTQFQSNENARNERFGNLEQKLESRVDNITEKHQTNLNEEFKSLAVKAGSALQVLNKYVDDAGKIFGVVTNTLQAGAYSSYANEEKSNANLLRKSAIGMMLIGVGILVIPELIKIYHYSANYLLDWKTVLGRIPFSIILFVPAFYLARESNKHRNTEIINRRRELILSTIDPYLVLLENEKAQQIKLEIAKEIFSEKSLAFNNETTINEASNLISQIANMVKQVRN